MPTNATALLYADVLVVLNRLHDAYVIVFYARLSDFDCLTASIVKAGATGSSTSCLFGLERLARLQLMVLCY